MPSLFLHRVPLKFIAPVSLPILSLPVIRFYFHLSLHFLVPMQILVLKYLRYHNVSISGLSITDSSRQRRDLLVLVTFVFY